MCIQMSIHMYHTLVYTFVSTYVLYIKNINHLHMCYYFSYLFTQVFIDLNSIYYI